MKVAISWGVQPASESRVTAVPLRSWKVSPAMPAFVGAAPQAFLKAFACQGRPRLLVSMMGDTRGSVSITA